MSAFQMPFIGSLACIISGFMLGRISSQTGKQKATSHCEDDLEIVGSSPGPQSAPDITMHIDNWGPGIAGKVVLAMDGGKIVASMALSDLLESCSPPAAGLEAVSIDDPAKEVGDE